LAEEGNRIILFKINVCMVLSSLSFTYNFAQLNVGVGY